MDAAWNLNRSVKHVTDVKEIYELCDFITIHVPALPSTKNMINKDAIDMMKDGVILINMARDSLVDEKEVIRAIEAGKIRRYVSDFPNPTVAGKPGCVTTPHLGASTQESEVKCAKMAVEEMQNYIENGNILNSVNYPRCDMGICTVQGRIAIHHKNQANMITQFTTIIGASDVNIAEMANKSKDTVAYTLIDIDGPADAELISMLRSVEGVYRVRVIK